MNPLPIASFLPGGLVAVVVLACLLTGVVVYALYCKGDVSVQLSRGKTVFKLEARERNSGRDSV